MRAFLGICLLLALFSCQSERQKRVESAPLISRTLTDALGRQVHFPRTPRRVISLAPNLTETMFAIGAGPLLAGRSQACDFPPEAEAIPEISTFPQLDLEQIQASGADMLLATDEIFTPQDIAALERLGIPLFVQSYRSLESIYGGMEQLGKLLELSGPARRAADSLRRREQDLRRATENQVRYGTLLLVSGDPLIVAGGKGYLQDLIAAAGGRNLFEDKPEAYARSTLEEILARQPEVIILPDKNQQVYGELTSAYPAIAATPAALSGQVFIIDPDLLFRPGPRLLEGLEQMARSLHTQIRLPGDLPHAE
jgi:iron complex transport system substrate-binding protein